jgi:hypothetical protein
MGSKLKKIGRAVGAGLTQLGADIKTREAQDKKDALLKEEREFREKRFQAERSDAEVRNEQLRIQTLMSKATYHSKAISSAFAMSGGNPAAMAEVLTKHNNDHRVYTYNEAASRAAVDPKTGEKLTDAVVYDMATYIEKPGGGFEVDPVTGKNVLDPLPGDLGQVQYNNGDDYTAAVTNAAHPSIALSKELSKVTLAEFREKQTNRAAANKKQLAGEIAGKIKVAEETGVTALNEAKAKAAGDVAGSKLKLVKIEGFDGEQHELNSTQSQKVRDDHKALLKTYDGITQNEAFKVSLLRDDPEDREDFRKAIESVLNNSTTEKDFLEDMMGEGVPLEFLRFSIEDARAHKEEFPDAVEDKKGYWNRFWKVFGL